VVKASAGDWLVVKGRTNDQTAHRGLITEIRSADGAPPYLVRWIDTGHETLVFPGPDAVVIASEDQQAADERARSRFASVQAAITRQSGSTLNG
jgi:hypothetical protein